MSPSSPASAPSRHTRPRGFTVIELVMVLMIIGLMYGFGAYVLFEIQRPREVRVQMDLHNLAYGIYGRGPGEHGYVADNGELPLPGAGEILSDYLSRPPLPDPPFEYHDNRISLGWHGPYASFDAKAIDMDPWGQPWILQSDGRIRSLGRDGIPSIDDLVVPDYSPIPRETVVGQIAIVVIDPRTGERVTDPDLLEILVSDFPDDREAIYESSIQAFVADDLAPGRKRIDVFGLDSLLDASAFTEVILPIGGVTSATLHLTRGIYHD